jgi:hypothetical protein
MSVRARDVSGLSVRPCGPRRPRGCRREGLPGGPPRELELQPARAKLSRAAHLPPEALVSPIRSTARVASAGRRLLGHLHPTPAPQRDPVGPDRSRRLPVRPHLNRLQNCPFLGQAHLSPVPQIGLLQAGGRGFKSRTLHQRKALETGPFAFMKAARPGFGEHSGEPRARNLTSPGGRWGRQLGRRRLAGGRRRARRDWRFDWRNASMGVGSAS